MKTLQIRRGTFFGVDYSADGRYLVSGNSGRHVRFWDLTTFEERLRVVLPHTARARAKTFFLHGPRLVLSTTVWDLTAAWDQLERGLAARRDLPLAGELFASLALAGEANFTTMAPGTPADRLIGAVWAHGQQATRILTWGPEGKLQRRTDVAQLNWGRLAVSPDGRLLVSATHFKGALLIDLSNGKTLATLDHTDDPRVFRFSPDGRLLAVAAGRTIWLWDVASRAVLARYPAFQCYAEALAFHPRGQYLAAGSGEGEVRVWHMGDRKQVACLDWKIGAVHGLAFSPDGMTVAAAGHNGTILIWDLE